MKKRSSTKESKRTGGAENRYLKLKDGAFEQYETSGHKYAKKGGTAE